MASQFRNLAGLVPGLLTEGSFATMATEVESEAGDGASMPHRLMAVCTFAATAVSMALAAGGIVLAPWLLRLMYGRAYGGAALAVAVGLSVAVLQMVILRRRRVFFFFILGRLRRSIRRGRC